MKCFDATTSGRDNLTGHVKMICRDSLFPQQRRDDDSRSKQLDPLMETTYIKTAYFLVGSPLSFIHTICEHLTQTIKTFYITELK